MTSPPSEAPSNTQRNPPPQLFRAPKNASSISLTSPSSTGTAQRFPLPRSRSARDSIDVPTLDRSSISGSQAQNVGQAEDSCVEALWARMQLTLEEVELSALGSTHVFGNAHNTALEELRTAQIALAKAWGRGEADEESPAMDTSWSGDDLDTEGANASKGAAEDGREVEEARRRREANERFFTKVGEGVEDVVGKLDNVAAAMAKVEKESREIWDEQDSGEVSSAAS